MKQTVNFDDPYTYHLYYGNDAATPGTIMTFFPWKDSHKGRVGSGQVGTIAFRIPKGTYHHWQTHLRKHDIDVEETNLFGKATLEFFDPHGLALALVEGEEKSTKQEILSFHGALLLSSAPTKTVNTLKNNLGLQLSHDEGEYYYLRTLGHEAHVIIVPKLSMPSGRFGVGTVHHIAWSVPNDKELREYQDVLYETSHGVTEIKDRKYFRAIYFKEPGNIVFEIATDSPGFTLDEPLSELGQHLQIPEQYKHLSEDILKQLPSINIKVGFN